MANEIEVYVEQTKALTEQKRGNYILTSPINGQQCELKRDKDFMVIKGTKKPSILKEGCEKICNMYGLIQRYELVTNINEYGDNPFFMYVVKCELVKLVSPEKEVVFATAFGSANSKEKNNGFASAYDSANRGIKMACKRALSSAVVAIGGLSDLFTMDIENENFMNQAQVTIDSTNPDAPISAKQTKRIFALAADLGLNAEQAKNKLKAAGFNSTKDVKQKDYDAVCNLFMADSAKEEPKAEPQKKTTRKKSSEA